MSAIALAATVVAIVAAVLLVIVLGYAGYEIAWKARRLRGDLAELQTLNGRLGELQTGIATARLRIAAASAGLR